MFHIFFEWPTGFSSSVKGVIVAPSICDGWFNDEWFPSYREIYEHFQNAFDQTEATRFEEQIAHNREYIERYRHAYAYHPWHGMSMLYMGGVAWQHTSAIFIPGARKLGHARAMGCISTAAIADALRQAERYVGKNPRILALPDVFASVPVHLHIRGSAHTSRALRVGNENQKNPRNVYASSSSELDVVFLEERMARFCATEFAPLKDFTLLKRNWEGNTANVFVAIVSRTHL